MYRARFRGVLLPLLGALLMIGGCGDATDRPPVEQAAPAGSWSTAGCEFLRLSEHVSIAGLTMPATPAKLDAAMQRIDRGGRDDFPDSYAGLEVDQAEVRAVVYRVPSAAFDDFIRRAAEDVCVVVRDAAHTAADLTTWHDRLLADLPFWTHRGIRIVSIGARHDGAGVDVGTRDLDRARLELPARYGSRAPFVFAAEGPILPLDQPTTAPRSN